MIWKAVDFVLVESDKEFHQNHTEYDSDQNRFIADEMKAVV